MKPTVGRIVHFYPMTAEVPGTELAAAEEAAALVPWAAIVIAVREVDGIAWPVLRILHETHPSNDFNIDCAPGGYERDGIFEAFEPKMGFWCWPPRV